MCSRGTNQATVLFKESLDRLYANGPVGPGGHRSNSELSKLKTSTCCPEVLLALDLCSCASKMGRKTKGGKDGEDGDDGNAMQDIRSTPLA